ncbi:hypothetical protein K492DRAFT_208687 [Lichtheimia hyalospora FSU 10163]|nr:hypothetical protein K492DRAFT_208687 [Lichtheimia hyalospora FSU 10163]
MRNKRHKPVAVKRNIDELVSEQEALLNNHTVVVADEKSSSQTINVSGEGSSYIHNGDNFIINNTPTTSSSSSSKKADETTDTTPKQQSFSFSPPPANKRYLLPNGFDVTYAFYQFQCSIHANAELYMESHVHHLLALSSIFLIKPGRNHKDILEIFGDDNIDLLEKLL